jgi:SnoaL-like domain
MVTKLVDDYLAALVGQTFDDYPMAEDVVFRGPRLGPIQGEPEVRAVLNRIAVAFGSYEVTSPGQLIDDQEAILFLDVELPDGRGFAIADHLSFADGRLRLLRPYFDAGILESLGVAPGIPDLGSAVHL